MLDTGNNSHIPTIVRNDHFTYGRDFAGHAATGKFSNSLLVPNLLSFKLGRQLSLPFMDPKLSEDGIRSGVNFASAGSRFDDMTWVLWNTAPMVMKLETFKSYRARLEEMVGEEADRIVGKPLDF
ncbi:GDSL esterase/lipase At1g06990-like [Elaeis guineensis]|uniref:GDSL esterase/lipase At1g06990-like n=1 Tax=Elaeis guineensis var. tenera TaxID=51953 RepID=A0A6I9S9V9_ELAGV|nr:GDSL esterase/lipase At1g06990-like [Elaeis guineensis]